jgi:hypothetical protein
MPPVMQRLLALPLGFKGAQRLVDHPLRISLRLVLVVLATFCDGRDNRVGVVVHAAKPGLEIRRIDSFGESDSLNDGAASFVDADDRQPVANRRRLRQRQRRSSSRASDK